MKAFERIAKNADEERVLLEQFASFHMKKGIYSMAATQMDAVTMEPIDWWLSYGSKTPELADVAKKVLSQPISSSSAERNWSSYSYIQNVKRNCLNCKTANKLVFIHSNLRLQSRFFEEYNQALTKSGTLILITQTWKAIELELRIGTYLILFYQFNILEREYANFICGMLVWKFTSDSRDHVEVPTVMSQDHVGVPVAASKRPHGGFPWHLV
uniref:HAT C-terminal dimerisation domain-containing protein n=1 Tax=Lactuca sativa TaxID=4236 RepID=A0A9R1VSH9_LACSA|nr:hypothetical protein LSAT_V11C400226420 [Lactuca sativa]